MRRPRPLHPVVQRLSPSQPNLHSHGKQLPSNFCGAPKSQAAPDTIDNLGLRASLATIYRRLLRGRGVRTWGSRADLGLSPTANLERAYLLPRLGREHAVDSGREILLIDEDSVPTPDLTTDEPEGLLSEQRLSD